LVPFPAAGFWGPKRRGVSRYLSEARMASGLGPMAKRRGNAGFVATGRGPTQTGAYARDVRLRREPCHDTDGMGLVGCRGEE
jgi:hypothetical protein